MRCVYQDDEGAARAAATSSVRRSSSCPWEWWSLALRVRALAGDGDGSVTIAQLRDDLSTSRKFAQALLEHFDGEKVTRRVGDAHILRRTYKN